MQETEERAFAAGRSAADLMEQAGAGMAEAIQQFFPRPGTAILFLGKGNNAGDALVAARHLLANGWQLAARLSAPPDLFKPLPRQHFDALGSSLAILDSALNPADLPSGPVLLLDGLVGLGAQGALAPALAGLVTEMNLLRDSGHAFTIAMDLPSGLDGDSGLPSHPTVVADLTLTVAQTKSGLVADAATAHVGRLVHIPLKDLDGSVGDATAEALTASRLRSLLPRRGFDFHKGQAGRLLIIAGSPGFYGAAELTCLGALNAGAGLVTLLAKPDGVPVLAARLPPEVMVRPVDSYLEALDLAHQALVIGPGLGRRSDAEIVHLFTHASAPMVVDADALNALAPLPTDCDPAGPRLLTPHPGEWARLNPHLATPALSRRQQVEAWASNHPKLTVLLKGARTVIASHGEPTRFNTTGHPGMATGGMGDVLSGVLGAFLAQGISPPHAAALGAWLCGRAAELDALHHQSLGTLPSSVARHLPLALRDLCEAVY